MCVTLHVTIAVLTDPYAMIKAPKPANPNNHGGMRVKKNTCLRPDLCRLLQTEGMDYRDDRGDLWAGGFLSEESMAIMKSKGGAAGLTDSEYFLVIHMSAQKIAINYNWDSRQIPFTAAVREMCHYLAKYCGYSGTALASMGRVPGIYKLIMSTHIQLW